MGLGVLGFRVSEFKVLLVGYLCRPLSRRGWRQRNHEAVDGQRLHEGQRQQPKMGFRGLKGFSVSGFRGQALGFETLRQV